MRRLGKSRWDEESGKILVQQGWNSPGGIRGLEKVQWDGKNGKAEKDGKIPVG